jgi:hypothetical protein
LNNRIGHHPAFLGLRGFFIVSEFSSDDLDFQSGQCEHNENTKDFMGDAAGMIWYFLHRFTDSNFYIKWEENHEFYIEKKAVSSACPGHARLLVRRAFGYRRRGG